MVLYFLCCPLGERTGFLALGVGGLEVGLEKNNLNGIVGVLFLAEGQLGLGLACVLPMEGWSL